MYTRKKKVVLVLLTVVLACMSLIFLLLRDVSSVFLIAAGILAWMALVSLWFTLFYVLKVEKDKKAEKFK